MKLFFSLFISVAMAREIIVISYNEHQYKADYVKNLLQKNLHIPPTLISQKKQTVPCRPYKEAFLHICFDQEGEMIIPVVNRQALGHTFNIFQANQKDKNE